MSGLIEIVDAGIGNSLQDLGRFGYRHMGIAVSGQPDPILARCANALVGNPPDCACIEIRAAGPALAVRQGRVRLALAGSINATLVRADGSEYDVPPWQSISLDPGEELQVGFLPGGTAYLAVSGGFLPQLELGSRSTYLRAGIGVPISFGQQIPCGALSLRGAHEFTAAPWQHDAGPIRVMPGPQDDHFKSEALADLVTHPYVASAQSDRMGMRLEGMALAHLTPAAADIVSDGVTPGVIQVPANGQPIILLADCQTVGGYPKIGTVISADLPRLAQVQPGQEIRFQWVDAAQAKAALLALETRWKWWAYAIAYGLPGAALPHDLRAGWPLPQ